jgi:hypothetical protein
MTTREFTKNEWERLFDALSRLSLGSKVDVEIVDPELGVQVAVTDSPLAGIVVDLKGEPRIAIVTGIEPDETAEHTIVGPSRVLLRTAELPFGDTLMIANDQGEQMLVRFRRALELPRPVETHV